MFWLTVFGLYAWGFWGWVYLDYNKISRKWGPWTEEILSRYHLIGIVLHYNPHFSRNERLSIMFWRAMITLALIYNLIYDQASPIVIAGLSGGIALVIGYFHSLLFSVNMQTCVAQIKWFGWLFSWVGLTTSIFCIIAAM